MIWAALSDEQRDWWCRWTQALETVPTIDTVLCRPCFTEPEFIDLLLDRRLELTAPDRSMILVQPRGV